MHQRREDPEMLDEFGRERRVDGLHQDGVARHTSGG
jgi:hypothetical protein